jgi:cytochrome c2
MRSSRTRLLTALGGTLLLGIVAHLTGFGRAMPRRSPPAEPLAPPRLRLGTWTIGLVLSGIVLAGVAIYAGYEIRRSHDKRQAAIALTGGDPDRGPALMLRYGCAGCHTIPGVTGARGQVGPNLQDVSRRVYLGGVATNTSDNLIRWIVNPREIDPKTAMPVTGVSAREARDIAAYLYSR